MSEAAEGTSGSETDAGGSVARNRRLDCVAKEGNGTERNGTRNLKKSRKDSQSTRAGELHSGSDRGDIDTCERTSKLRSAIRQLK